MADDDETKDLLRAIGRAIEEQGRATRQLVGYLVAAAVIVGVVVGLVVIAAT